MTQSLPAGVTLMLTSLIRPVCAGAVRASRTASLAMIVLLAGAAPALAVSTHDIVALAKAGLSDDVLIALVEADQTVFALDAPQILELRREGLSERVILAMIRSGRRGPAADGAVATPAGAGEAADEPPPLVVIGEQPAPQPLTVQQTNVILVPFVPYVMPPARPRPAPAPPAYRGFGRFMNDGWIDGKPPSGAH
jgi:hypothetical protein